MTWSFAFYDPRKSVSSVVKISNIFGWELTYDLTGIQPSLRDLGHSKLASALKRQAIFTTSLRDKALAEFPKDTRPPYWLLICLTRAFPRWD
jgi:hypothetical protein